MAAEIISFINMKGGVGKTTLCKEVGNYLANRFTIGQRPVRVLLIDIDPQSNLTQALNERFEHNIKTLNSKTEGSKKCSIENIFDKEITGLKEEDVILKLTKNLHLIPGELETVFLERSQNSNTASKLLDFIKDFSIKDKYDFILLDCPPTYSIYTEMAFYCSDFYFVPVVPDAYSTLGVDLLERVVSDIIYQKRNSIFEKRQPKNLGVIYTRLDLRNKPQQQTFINALARTKLVQQKGIHIFKSRFLESNKLSTSQFDKLITDREDARLDSMVLDICEEIIARIGEINNAELIKEN